ncbi:unnamed protein product [Darwinula stevensoni]|uniref:cystathionine gamma-lyase n=1 Tax=Darwinula stevensoni TaxID=69355 RepID=A0A7R8X4Q6_9CRUS|nr:unnamed protein product [Darwinula stevensoni]CAG0883920.1 unnamed protein product [Darwinula stevensoni]
MGPVHETRSMKEYVAGARFATRAVHEGHDPDDWKAKDVVPPITLSTTFKQFAPSHHAGFEYGRSGNPSRQCLERCIASLEDAKYGLCFSSGLSAMTTLLHLLKSGDHVISNDDLYGGSNRYFRKVLNRSDIQVTFVDMANHPDKVLSAMTPKTKMVWMETPTNPTMKLVDIKKVADMAHQQPGTIVVVDNTFMTPYFQKPLMLGADVSMHSVTKYINGHSDVIMGAVAINDEALYEELAFLQNSMGTVPSPFDCYLVTRSVRTLPLRMQAHMTAALIVARFLEKHPCVEKVLHPGLESHPQYELGKKQMQGHSGMLSFYIKGGLEESQIFFSHLKLFTLAESLGGFESLAELPALMTHSSVPDKQREELGIGNNLVRLSVGLEDPQDLIEELDHALRAAVSLFIFSGSSDLKEEAMSNKYNLKWNSHHAETFQSFENLRHREMFVDATLSCNGQFLKAHKLVLCAGSGYFERILNKEGSGTPTIHFYGIEMHLLKLLVEFMYCGEVEVPAMDLEKFIEVAENLEVKGLKGDKSKSSGSHNAVGGTTIPVSDVHDALAHKRKSAVQAWHGLGNSQYPPAKIPRSHAPIPQSRSQFTGSSSQQKEAAPCPSNAFLSHPEPSTSTSSDEVLIKDEADDEELNDIRDVDSAAAAAEEHQWDEQWDEQSGGSYCVEGMEGDPEKPLNVPAEVDPQMMKKIDYLVWMGEVSGSAGLKLYFCARCHYRSSSKRNAMRHRYTHMQTVEYVRNGVWKGQMGTQTLFFCGLCEYKTVQRSNAVSQHWRLHSSAKSYKCNSVEYVRDGIWKGTVSNGFPLFFCGSCDYKTSRRGNALYQHTRAHSSFKAYRCGRCSAAFKWKISLVNHMTLTHGGS